MRSDIALIDSPHRESLMRMIGCSRWQVTELPDTDSAVEQAASGLCPIVICGAEGWHKVVQAAKKAARPPAVVVVSAHTNDLEWLQILEAGAHYLPLDRIDDARLFSLLSLLWRGYHRN